MTVGASALGVVCDGIDLREAGGPGRIELVAQQAGIPPPWNVWFCVHWSSDVVCRRPMAHLAGDSGVVRGNPKFFDIRVAQRTLLAAGVFLLVACYRVNGRRPVMAQVTEGFGNKEAPAQEEGGSEQDEYDEKTSDLLRHAVHLFQSEFEDGGNRESRKYLR